MKFFMLSMFLSSSLTGCLLAPPNLSDAIPTDQEVRVKLPEEAGVEQAALGELSEYYSHTRGISHGLNTVATSILGIVHLVLEMPPTSIDGNTYVWGPGSQPLDPADYRMTAIEYEDGSFDWKLEARSKIELDAEFLVVLAGYAEPGYEAHRGKGDFMIDLDVIREVDPTAEGETRGQATFVYDLASTYVYSSLDIHFDSYDEDENPLVGDYHYEESEDRAGELLFAIPADVGEDGSALEDVILRSRWLPSGAGRGDARISGGDLGELIVEGSQCWSESFRTVYHHDTAGIQPSAGSVDDCAFLEADLPE